MLCCVIVPLCFTSLYSQLYIHAFVRPNKKKKKRKIVYTASQISVSFGDRVIAFDTGS